MISLPGSLIVVTSTYSAAQGRAQQEHRRNLLSVSTRVRVVCLLIGIVAPAVVGACPAPPEGYIGGPVERLSQLRHWAVGRQQEDHRVRRDLFRQVPAAIHVHHPAGLDDPASV